MQEAAGTAVQRRRSRLPDRLRTVRLAPWVVSVVLAVAALVAGGAWAVASPVGSSPDDDYHQSSIWCPPPLASSGCRLVIDASGAVKGAYVPQSVARSVCYAMRNEESASCLRGISDEQLIPYEHIDQGAYPGGYYRFMHLFVTPDVTASIVTIRVVNVALAVLLLSCGLWLLPRSARQGQAAATIGGLVPLGMFLIASVNPSSWAVTGILATWLAVHTLLQAEERWRMVAASVLAVVAAVVAANARSDSGAYLVVVAGLAGLLHVRTLRTWWPRLAVLVIPALLGLWSFLGSSQTSAISSGWAGMEGRNPRVVLYKDVQELPNLLMGVFGQVWGLGWLDTPLPAVVSSSALFVACGLVMVGFAQMNVTKTLTAGLLLATIFAVALAGLLASNYFVGEGIQPRYLLPLIPVLIGIMLTGTTLSAPVALARPQLVVFALALTLANSVALFTNLRRYVTGLDVTSPFLNRSVEWWWSTGPAPSDAWLIGSLAFAVLTIAPWILTVRPAAAEPARPDATPPAEAQAAA